MTRFPDEGRREKREKEIKVREGKADTRLIVAPRLPIVQKFRQSSPICVFFSNATKMR